jgi:hypothetical protein
MQVEQAEAGWRELLCEKRAKLRGRVTELDIKHAAARMIQVGLAAAAAAAAAAASAVAVLSHWNAVR